MRERLRFANWILAVLLVISPSWVHASTPFQAQDVQQAELSGLVKDEAGAVVPGAAVTVRVGDVVVAQTTTDADGLFRFAGEPGQYKVDVRTAGFAPILGAEIPFAADGPSRFTLKADSSYSGPVVQPSPVLRTRNFGSVDAVRLQESPVSGEASKAPWEYGALFQGGLGLTEDRSNFRFLLAGAHVGKVLTGELGSGALRGNFEYAGELFPYWQSFTPKFQRIKCVDVPVPVGASGSVCSGPYTVGGTFTGMSVTPIILRWNFTGGRRVMPWVQGAGGLIWTNHKYPAYGDTNSADVATTGPNSDTSVWNFTPQFGVGAHFFLKPRRSLDFSANAVHISSASLGDRNPGVNASVQFSVGYTWWSR